MNVNQSLLLLLCVVTGFGCSQPSAIPEAVREGLQGPVKCVVWQQVNKVWSNHEIIDIRLEIMYKDQYDRKGYKTSHQMYSWIDTPVNGEPYGNHAGTIWKYTVNQYGHRVLTETIDPRGEVNTYFYQYYDNEGYLTLEKYLDKDKNFIREWIVERDAEKMVNYVTVKNATGVIEGQSEWHYDDNGLYIQKGFIIPNDSVWSYINDEDGTQLYFQRTDFDWEKKVKAIHAERYNHSRQKQWAFYHDFQHDRSQYFEFEYEVDEFGNWISEAQYVLTRKNGQDQKDLVHSRFREIEYYDD